MSSELTEQEFKDLKEEVQEARATADRAKGAMETLVKTLKDEFECDSPKEAKALLEKLEREMEKAQKAFDEAREDYQEKWHGGN